jgi:uncharacterized repeat protein (TIGR01451 family)
MSLVAGGLIAALLPTGFAWADCVKAPGDPSVFSLLIDATSSCQAMSANMSGCRVDAATGQCTITRGAESITVKLTQGSVGSSTPFSWQVISSNTENPKAGTVDFSIAIGATGGGTCGWSYSPGSSFGSGTAFLKSNGSYQKINDIYFCADFSAPPPQLPRLSLKKTVMAQGGTCGVNDADLIDAKTGQQVEYCYVVDNLGNGDANNLVLVDDLGTPSDTGDDVFITLSGLNGGVLAAGGRATGKSPAVSLTAAGKLINTATVNGDSVDYPSYDVAYAIDTATVNVSQSLVTCPADFQKAVNQLVTETDDFTYAVLHNPKKPEDVSVCVPTNEDPNYVRVRGISCIDECILKPGCDQTPLPAGCSPQVCQSSESWTTHDENGVCQGPASFTAGKLPYCWEVEQDLNQDCELNDTQPMKTHEVDTKQIHANPYVYQSCTKSGGRKVCTTYCYLYPGETSSVCPSGSIIQ